MDSLLTGLQIISQLRAEKSFLNEKFGVVDIGLFGSFAIGQPNRDSDIDLFVALKEPRFDWIAGLQVYLENKFNRKIGLIRKGNPSNQHFEKTVEKEIIYA
jgi:predicted nucleotidyltransferase